MVGVIGEVEPIGDITTTTVSFDDGSTTTSFEQELVADLETDEQVTGEDLERCSSNLFSIRWESKN